jgi:hypothetical protein
MCDGKVKEQKGKKVRHETGCYDKKNKIIAAGFMLYLEGVACGY